MDQYQQYPPMPPAPVPPKKNNTPVIITVIICVSVVIIAALVTVIILKSNDGSSKQTDPTVPATLPASDPLTEPETEPKTEPRTEPKTEPKTDPATESKMYMPDVIYHSEKYAVDMLEEMGLDVVVRYFHTGKASEGNVDQQIPDPGTAVKKGETVYIYVMKDKYTEPPTQPPTSPPTQPASVWPPKNALLYVTADDYVSLREMPGENYPEITKIYNGEMMGYLNDKKGKWLYVQYGNYKGYVYADYVETRY